MLFDELWGRSTPNSWARVPRGPVAAAVGSFVFGATATAITVAGTAITWGTIGGWLITTAITTWALSALAPKMPNGGTQRGLLQNIREPIGSFDVVYGTIRKGGVITFMKSTGNKNKYMHYVLALAGHEVSAIRDIYIGDEVVNLDANGFVTGNRWKSKIRIRKHLGSPTQTADSLLVSEAGLDSTFRGRGVAYLYVRLEYDQEVFADGTPTITAVVDGKKVFDPRDGTTVFTANAALCIRDYLASEYGLKAPSETLASASWGNMATVCDENMPLKGGGTEKRYSVNGVISTANSPRNNIEKMLTACGGTLFWGQGAWHVKVGFFPAGPYLSFNENDFRSGIDLMTKQSRKDTYNVIRGTFVNSSQDWIEADYPEFRSTAFIALDGGQENIMDMEFPMSTSAAAVQRLSKMSLFRSREEMSFAADFSLKAIEAQVGDVVQINFERYGWVNKFFEVVAWKINPDGGELKINLVLKESSAAAYSWNAEEKDITSNNTILPTPGAGLSIANLQVTNLETLQNDGSYLGEVRLDWDEPDAPFLEEYDVNWRKHSDLNWSSTTSQENSIILSGIVGGQPYYYRVRAKSIGGFVGAWTQISSTVVGKTTPPNLPTAIKAENAYRSVNLSWTNPTNKDLNHIEVWRNSTNSTTGAQLLGRSGGSTFIHGPIEPAVTHWYFLRAVNNSELKSGYTAGVSGMGLYIENSDVDIDVKELLEQAGVAPVEVLDALPTTGNTVGRTVYLTTDNKLYTWDGTAWKSVDSEWNGMLDSSNFPADLRPIEVVTTLPTTGNTKGRVVFLTTDNKLYRWDGTAWVSSVQTSDLIGQIVSDQLAENAVTPDKLATIPGYNLLPDPRLETPNAWNFNPSFWSMSGNKIIYSRTVGSGFSQVTTKKLITVIPNTTYRMSVKYDNITNTPGQWRFIFQFLDINGVVISSVGSWGRQLDLVGETVVYEGTAPANAASVYIQIGGSVISTIEFSEIQFYHISNAATIANNAIETAKIANGAIESGKLADNAATAAKIATGAITETKISDNAITSPKVMAGAIIAGKIATDAVSAGNIQAGAIEAGKIAAGAVTTDKLDALAVTAAKIAAGAIETDKLAANSVTSAKILAGAIETDKLAANSVTTDKLVADSITTIKIAAGAITSDKLEANSVIAGKIAAGAIGADEIRANSITATKLLIADWTNIVPDNQLQDINSWSITNPDAATFKAGSLLTIKPQSLNYIEFSGPLSGGTFSRVHSAEFTVNPGEELFCQGEGWRQSGSAPDSGITFHIQFKDGDGNWLNPATRFYYRFLTAEGLQSGPQIQSLSVTVPTEARSGRIFISMLAGTDGTWVAASPTVRRKSNGELIVNGAITAEKLAANSVVAGVIAAGAIQSAAIATGAVTAAKINVNLLSAISADLGAITAGSINIGAGRFVVNSAGNVTIRSGTTGERLVITNSRIDVYDASGTLRVRMGQL